MVIRPSVVWFQAVLSAIRRAFHSVHSYFRKMRSPSRMMRLYNSNWRLLVVMIFVTETTFGLALASSLLWKEVLTESPSMFAKTPWMQQLLVRPMAFQFLSLPFLLILWLFFRKWSKRKALGFIPAPFVVKAEGLLSSHPRLFGLKALAMIRDRKRGRRHLTDPHFLETLYASDDAYRRDLNYCMNRSGMQTTRRYLEGKYNKRIIAVFVGWLAYFGYAELVLPFLTMVAPKLGWLFSDNPTLRNLASVAAIIGPLVVANTRLSIHPHHGIRKN